MAKSFSNQEIDMYLSAFSTYFEYLLHITRTFNGDMWFGKQLPTIRPQKGFPPGSAFARVEQPIPFSHGQKEP